MSSSIRSTSRQQFIAIIFALVAAACGGDDSTPTSPSANVPYSQTDLRVGIGAEAVAGRRITVHYTLWLYSANAAGNKGQQVESSVGGSPLQPFVLGTGAVIRGWDQGVVGMRVGGQRRLVIPPELAYGSASAGGGRIPPNATLIFEIELLDVS